MSGGARSTDESPSVDESPSTVGSLAVASDDGRRDASIESVSDDTTAAHVSGPLHDASAAMRTVRRAVIAGGASILLASAVDAQVTLRLARLPASTPAGATIYVAGSFNGWNPADSLYRLRRTADGGYAITLPEAVRGPVEFKFTLGAWERVETDSAGGGVQNRRFEVPPAGAITWTGDIGGWQDPAKIPVRRSTRRATVSVIDTAFAIPQLGRTRRVWIYLPPGYAASTRRYPVLYMQDGQNLFDDSTSFAGEWGVDESLDSLHARGDEGVIVVGVDNGGPHRLDEYSPWKNARYGGGEGDAYAEFLVRTLKPYVDQHYRTRTDRESTGIGGSSMGGLISLYAALRYPEVFGRAAVFSPSLWFAPQVYAFARAARRPLPGTRMYFVTGAKEGGTPEVEVANQARMIDTLATRDFRVGRNVEAFVRPDGQHAEWFWRREFPAAYEWLFGDDDRSTAHPSGSAGRGRSTQRRPSPTAARQ
jgi:predicted alpha/beta superfamily hydrolase